MSIVVFACLEQIEHWSRLWFAGSLAHRHDNIICCMQSIRWLIRCHTFALQRMAPHSPRSYLLLCFIPVFRALPHSQLCTDFFHNTCLFSSSVWMHAIVKHTCTHIPKLGICSRNGPANDHTAMEAINDNRQLRPSRHGMRVVSRQSNWNELSTKPTHTHSINLAQY